MIIRYTELSKSQLTKIYRELERIMDDPKGSTRKARLRYVFENLQRIFPGHIVYVSKSLTYFMQAKKGSSLLAKGKTGVIALVYSPRPYAVPRLHKFVHFSEKQKKEFELDGEKGGYVKEVKVVLNSMAKVGKQDAKQAGLGIGDKMVSKEQLEEIQDFITVYLNHYVYKEEGNPDQKMVRDLILVYYESKVEYW